MSLAGKTLFITGASRGIGLAIALRAARDGANIAIAAKTAEPHPKLAGTIYTAAEEIERAGGKALPLVGRRPRRSNGARRARPRPRRENSAASISSSTMPARSSSRRVADTDMKRFDLMHQINARGTFVVSKWAIRHLAKAANPHILMISPPLDMKEKWFAPHTAYCDGEIRHEPRGARASPASCGRRASPSTRCGRGPSSPPPPCKICSAAMP